MNERSVDITIRNILKKHIPIEMPAAVRTFTREIPLSSKFQIRIAPSMLTSIMPMTRMIIKEIRGLPSNNTVIINTPAVQK